MRQTLEEQGVQGERLHCQIRQAYIERLGLEPLIHEKYKNRTKMNKSATINDTKNDTNNADQFKLLTFEKTPNYMLWPHVPAAIRDTCPWKPRIIMVLRNPVDRLYSQYQMQFVQQDNVTTLENVLEHELKLLRKFGLSRAPPPPLMPLTTTKEAKQDEFNTQNTTTWYSFAPPKLSTEQRDAKESIRFRGFGNHGSFHRYLQRGMYFYQIQRWLQYWELDVDLYVVPYEEMKQDPGAVYAKIVAFVGADTYPLSPASLRATYRPSLDADNRQGMQHAAPLSNSTRAYLVEFYRPYNTLLADVLGDAWRGIWDV